MRELESAIAQVMGRQVPSSRELFGEWGADHTSNGMRMDPIVCTVWRTLQLVLSALEEKLEAVCAKDSVLNPDYPFFRYSPLCEASVAELQIVRHMVREHNSVFFGNQSTGMFRQFEYLRRTVGEKVNFSRFIPWLHLIENVQHVSLGNHFVVINLLPDELVATETHLTRRWLSSEGEIKLMSSARWDPLFGRS